MKLAIASDLHLEICDITINNTDGADVLILAGDILLADDLHNHPSIGISYTEDELKKLGSRQRATYTYRTFLNHVSKEFPKVIYIAGNHEFYHGKWHASLDDLYEECSKYPNIHFMEDQSISIDDVTFIGSTLWTNCHKNDPIALSVIHGAMNDYQLIRDDTKGYTKLRPATTSWRHSRSLDFFKKTLLENSSTKCVIISHHAPSFKSVHERYIQEYMTNGAYASDLSEFILDHPQIKLWIHGHMHNVNDYMIGDTQIISNPRGYVGYERGTQDIDPYYPLIVEV